MIKVLSYRYIPVILTVLTFVFSSCSAQKKWELNSPDGKLCVCIELTKLKNNSVGTSQSEKLFYTISCKEDKEVITIVEPSPLGIQLEDQSFKEQLQLESVKTSVIDENYRLLHGKRKECRDFSNELILSFRNSNNAGIDAVFRAYNDGIAFKYNLPGKDSTLHTLIKEETGFNLPSDGSAFMLPHDDVTDWGPAYEQYFQKEIKIGTASPHKAGWSFPALFEVSDGSFWVLLTEAGLDETYFGSRLEQEAPGGLYRIRMPNIGEGNNIGEVSQSSSLPWSTPWRVIMIGKSLADIVESSLVTHLAPPSVIKDTDWIKPGRASWSWWSDGTSPKDYNKLIKFIDFSAEMEWEYSLVDANWNLIGDEKIRQLVSYANNKSVGLFFWYNSGGPHNNVREMPRDKMFEREIRRAEFRYLNELGVKGVKVDFFHSDKQDRIKQYIDILKDAEEFKLMVVFHGCTLPRGWERTYPHLLTMEAVKGEECYRFDQKFPANAPSHNTILPFTRNVIGPMDYTPVAFSNNKYPHLTSFAHELALPVVFESGLQHFADGTESYRNQPESVIDFLRNIPVVWDNIKLLSGYPGKDVIIARQSNNDWFIGGINGENLVKTEEIDLSFIGEGDFEMTLIKDGETSTQYSVQSNLVHSDQPLQIEMLPYGGFVAKISRKK